MPNAYFCTVKISASIYSKADLDLEQVVADLDHIGIDFFHVDCMDDKTVFDDIQKINSLSTTPIDLHIISSNPTAFDDLLRENPVAQVCYQLEDLNSNFTIPSIEGIRFGISIVNDTPLDRFGPFADSADFVLLMTTTPGRSGGEFDKNTFKRIREFRNTYRGIPIHVDGGVNEEVSFILRNMGVEMAVSGSYLVGARSFGAALMNLKHKENPSHFLIRDFMLPGSECPVIAENDLDLKGVLLAIEKGRMGFVNVVKKDGTFAGIISNADLRKALLANLEDIGGMNVREMINNDPISIKENQNVRDLLLTVKAQNFPVLYVPVLDDSERMVGVVKFNNLIKGEL